MGCWVGWVYGHLFGVNIPRRSWVWLCLEDVGGDKVHVMDGGKWDG